MPIAAYEDKYIFSNHQASPWHPPPLSGPTRSSSMSLYVMMLHVVFSRQLLIGWYDALFVGFSPCKIYFKWFTFSDQGQPKIVSFLRGNLLFLGCRAHFFAKPPCFHSYGNSKERATRGSSRYLPM